MDKHVLKEVVSQNYTMADPIEARHMKEQQAEMYIRSVVELEGQNLSETTRNYLIKLIQDS
jgi:hypothetical protein